MHVRHNMSREDARTTLETANWPTRLNSDEWETEEEDDGGDGGDGEDNGGGGSEGEGPAIESRVGDSDRSNRAQKRRRVDRGGGGGGGGAVAE